MGVQSWVTKQVKNCLNGGLPLKDLVRNSSGGGEISRFLVHSKSLSEKSRCRSEVGQLFPRKYDPVGCARGTQSAQSVSYCQNVGPFGFVVDIIFSGIALVKYLLNCVTDLI